MHASRSPLVHWPRGQTSSACSSSFGERGARGRAKAGRFFFPRAEKTRRVVGRGGAPPPPTTKKQNPLASPLLIRPHPLSRGRPSCSMTSPMWPSRLWGEAGEEGARTGARQRQIFSRRKNPPAARPIARAPTKPPPACSTRQIIPKLKNLTPPTNTKHRVNNKTSLFLLSHTHLDRPKTCFLDSSFFCPVCFFVGFGATAARA